jgi:hypothetical protein
MPLYFHVNLITYTDLKESQNYFNAPQLSETPECIFQLRFRSHEIAVDLWEGTTFNERVNYPIHRLQIC